MPQYRLNPLMAISSRLELYCNNVLLGPATGFFVEHKTGVFLISNWHVLSGRDTYSGQPLNSLCAVPDKCRIYAKSVEGDEFVDRMVEVSLIDDDGNNCWVQHPIRGQDFDVAAIMLPQLDRLATPVTLPLETFGADLYADVGTDVLIAGFPVGLSKQFNLPVWKRGTIASSPDLPFDDLPLLVVDCATRKGMSGSPVFVVQQGMIIRRDGSGSIATGRIVRFMGVYSGRYGATEFEAQLGRVWNPEIVTQVIDGNTRGNEVIR